MTIWRLFPYSRAGDLREAKGCKWEGRPGVF